MDLTNLLIESFDRQLNSIEQAQLDQALANDPQLRDEKARLESIRSALADLQVAPKIGFADSVMSKVVHQPKAGILRQMNRWFPHIAAASILVFALSLISIYQTSGSLDTDNLIGYQELQPEEANYLLND